MLISEKKVLNENSINNKFELEYVYLDVLNDENMVVVQPITTKNGSLKSNWFCYICCFYIFVGSVFFLNLYLSCFFKFSILVLLLINNFFLTMLNIRVIQTIYIDTYFVLEYNVTKIN